MRREREKRLFLINVSFLFLCLFVVHPLRADFLERVVLDDAFLERAEIDFSIIVIFSSLLLLLLLSLLFGDGAEVRL